MRMTGLSPTIWPNAVASLGSIAMGSSLGKSWTSERPTRKVVPAGTVTSRTDTPSSHVPLLEPRSRTVNPPSAGAIET